MLEGGEGGEDAFAQVPLEELKALRPADQHTCQINHQRRTLIFT